MAGPAAAGEIVSAIQSASLNRHPDPKLDITPSTAADHKQALSPADSDLDSVSSDASESTIPLPSFRPAQRTRKFPPLPDLRFEQSYLASIRHAENGQAVAWITFRDQVMMPLVQGTLWALVLHGWRHWNRGVKLQGESLGAKIRRWWWGVNSWKLPEDTAAKTEL